jgi:ABC-2 type transport system permease protein
MLNLLNALLRIFALTRKELLAVLKDPQSRFSLLGPPVIQCFIFGYAATYDLNDIPYAVLDQDHSVASYDLLAGLDGSGVFHRVANLQRADDITLLINNRKALLVFQIGQDFQRRLLSGLEADVQIIADGRNSNTAGTAMGYASAIVETFNSQWRSDHGQGNPAVRVTTRAWFNENLETRWHMIPSLIGTLTMLQTLLLTAMSVAREREQGTFDQLLVTPFRPIEIMAGKALPSVLIGTTQATAILLVAQLWFHIPFVGSFLTLYICLGVFLLAAVGVGLLVSSVVATMQQAMLFGFVLILPFTLLSGLTTPISTMPVSLQYLTLINPLRYAIDMVQRIYMEGVGLEVLAPDLWPLVVMATITLSAASWMFRHRLA